MLIGFDFDNTIVSYDSLFHKVAAEQGLIPGDLAKSKLAVRDYLRSIDNEDAWTEMQGYVYGARMDEAESYPGVIDFMRKLHKQGVDMVIVSHKTKHPFIGPQYDLHEAARGWISKFLQDGTDGVLDDEQIFFEITKKEKVARIAERGCDYYIDDLPEILNMEGFPSDTKRVLFDPECKHDDQGYDARLGNWRDISGYFEALW